jgi:hypothetical protein
MLGAAAGYMVKVYDRETMIAYFKNLEKITEEEQMNFYAILFGAFTVHWECRAEIAVMDRYNYQYEAKLVGSKSMKGGVAKMLSLKHVEQVSSIRDALVPVHPLLNITVKKFAGTEYDRLRRMKGIFFVKTVDKVSVSSIH